MKNKTHINTPNLALPEQLYKLAAHSFNYGLCVSRLEVSSLVPYEETAGAAYQVSLHC